MKYDLLVDGDRTARVGSEEEVRDWLVRYRADHREDDPDAAHVLVLERSPFAFLTGGKLVDRERFL